MPGLSSEPLRFLGVVLNESMLYTSIQVYEYTSIHSTIVVYTIVVYEYVYKYTSIRVYTVRVYSYWTLTLADCSNLGGQVNFWNPYQENITLSPWKYHI